MASYRFTIDIEISGDLADEDAWQINRQVEKQLNNHPDMFGTVQGEDLVPSPPEEPYEG